MITAEESRKQRVTKPICTGQGNCVVAVKIRWTATCGTRQITRKTTSYYVYRCCLCIFYTNTSLSYLSRRLIARSSMSSSSSSTLGSLVKDARNTRIWGTKPQLMEQITLSTTFYIYTRVHSTLNTTIKKFIDQSTSGLSYSVQIKNKFGAVAFRRNRRSLGKRIAEHKARNVGLREKKKNWCSRPKYRQPILLRPQSNA